MKFLIFVILIVVAVAQTKVLMGPFALNEAFEKNEIGEGPIVRMAMQTEMLYIPMASNVACNNAGCNAVCQALGYRHGICINSNTCQCS